MIALTENGRLGPLYVEFPGEGDELTYLCSVHTALEQVSERRRERDMPVPRFESLDDAAGFVVRHHRLPSILTIEDVAPFIEFIYDHADGESTLPSMVLQYFRLKIESIDSDLGANDG
jgi:hypothetical protein